MANKALKRSEVNEIMNKPVHEYSAGAVQARIDWYRSRMTPAQFETFHKIDATLNQLLAKMR